MAKDLRTYLNQLERTCPDELMRVPGKISSHLEATTFLRKLELEGKAPNDHFPAALPRSTAPRAPIHLYSMPFRPGKSSAPLWTWIWRIIRCPSPWS